MLPRQMRHAGQMPPVEFRSVFGRQVLVDECAHTGERLKRQQVGDDY
jgi:hypothetical protein